MKQRKEGIFHIFLKGGCANIRSGEAKGEMQRERRLFEIEKRCFQRNGKIKKG